MIKRDVQVAGEYGILRKLMDSDEIKIANRLCKEGLLRKGTSDDKQKSVTFFSVD